ncbi:DUF1360 domain-containing protein [Salipaludibacillus sp. HK11]|uniref:DUF1360 domain-containing protein n=1 Tax=Salipaludibacillus sp. HK11 TaxID=3394320 RepID=UPI0039FC17A9
MIFTWFEFILIGLAVFRLTHLFLYDKITEPLRFLFLKEEKIINEEGSDEWIYVAKGRGLQKFIGEIFNCHWCLSVWISGFILVGFLVLPQVTIYVIYLFAIAAVAVVLEEIVLKFL